jgi:hypothetical protein
MAEREGFEPSVGFPTHDFQSCPLDQLGHLSILNGSALYIIFDFQIKIKPFFYFHRLHDPDIIIGIYMAYSILLFLYHFRNRK